MSMKRKLLPLALLAALGLAGPAHAVRLGEDGTGEALIYPYYTVRDNYFTLVSVVNAADVAKAVRVRFREGKNGRETLAFNLYLAANDVWTGALEATADGTQLSTSDHSCTVPAIATSQGGSGVTLFRNDAYAGSNADGEDATLNRTREGYLEILEMGELNTSTITRSTTGTISVTNAVTHVSGTPADCGAMIKAWAPGGAFTGNANANANNYVTPPAGRLFGGASIIRTDIGTDYSYDAVALEAWSDADLHAAPTAAAPTLADVSPKTSEAAGVTSQWANQQAVDPVSAVLMRSAVMNEYTVEQIVNAGTDWIVTFPTKHFYVGVDSTGATDADSGQRFFERPFSDDFWTGGACEWIKQSDFDTYFSHYFDRESQHPTGKDEVDILSPPYPGLYWCWEVQTTTFNEGSILESKLAVASNVNVSTFLHGWMYVPLNEDTLHSAQDGFNGTPSYAGDLTTGATDTTERARRMVSDEGHTYHGLPVVGFMAQEFVKGDGSLDNYGGVFVHKYLRHIETGN